MTDHTSAEALRKALQRSEQYLVLAVHDSKGDLRTIAQRDLEMVRAALSLPQAQGVAEVHLVNSEIVDAYIKAVEGFADNKTSFRQDIRHGLETVAPLIAKRAIHTTQGVTITDEMVERALYAQLCVFRTGYRLKRISFEEMKTFEKLQERWDDGVKAMRAALEATSLPKGPAQGEGIVPALLAHDEVIDRLRAALRMFVDMPEKFEESAFLDGIHQMSAAFANARAVLTSTPTDRGNALLNPDEAEEHIAENRL